MLPVPLMTPEYVEVLERLKIRLALLVMLPLRSPVVVLLPICTVPTLITTPPKMAFPPVSENVPAPTLTSVPLAPRSLNPPENVVLVPAEPTVQVEAPMTTFPAPLSEAIDWL